MFDVKYEVAKEHTIEEIRNFQRANKIIFPSDYIFLLLNYNEFVLADDQFGGIISDDGEELSGLSSPIFSLPDFYRANFEWIAEMKSYYNFSINQYFFIGELHYNGALLIGNTPENQNKIYIDLPQTHYEVIEVAEDFFDLINNELRIE